MGNAASNLIDPSIQGTRPEPPGNEKDILPKPRRNRIDEFARIQEQRALQRNRTRRNIPTVTVPLQETLSGRKRTLKEMSAKEEPPISTRTRQAQKPEPTIANRLLAKRKEKIVVPPTPIVKKTIKPLVKPVIQEDVIPEPLVKKPVKLSLAEKLVASIPKNKIIDQPFQLPANFLSDLKPSAPLVKTSIYNKLSKKIDTLPLVEDDFTLPEEYLSSLSEMKEDEAEDEAQADAEPKSAFAKKLLKSLADKKEPVNFNLPANFFSSNLTTLSGAHDVELGFTEEQKKDDRVLTMIRTAAFSDFKHDFIRANTKEIMKEIISGGGERGAGGLIKVYNKQNMIDKFTYEKALKNLDRDIKTKFSNVGTIWKLFSENLVAEKILANDPITSVLPPGSIPDYKTEDEILDSVGADLTIKHIRQGLYIKSGVFRGPDYRTKITADVLKDTLSPIVSTKEKGSFNYLQPFTTINVARQYSLTSAITKIRDEYITLASAFEALAHIPGPVEKPAIYVMLVDAQRAHLSELLLRNYAELPGFNRSREYHFYFIGSSENDADPAGKIGKFVQGPNKLSNVKVFYLRDIGIKTHYTQFGNKDGGSKSLFYSNCAIDLERVDNRSIKGTFSFANKTTEISNNLANASKVPVASLSAIQKLLKYYNTPTLQSDNSSAYSDIAVHFLMKRAGDWLQALTVLDILRSYTVYDYTNETPEQVMENGQPKRITLADLHDQGAEIGLMTHDKILLAFCLMLGVNVFFSSKIIPDSMKEQEEGKNSFVWMIYFKNKTETTPDITKGYLSKMLYFRSEFEHIEKSLVDFKQQTDTLKVQFLSKINTTIMESVGVDRNTPYLPPSLFLSNFPYVIFLIRIYFYIGNQIPTKEIIDTLEYQMSDFKKIVFNDENKKKVSDIGFQQKLDAFGDFIGNLDDMKENLKKIQHIMDMIIDLDPDDTLLVNKLQNISIIQSLFADNNPPYKDDIDVILKVNEIFQTNLAQDPDGFYLVDEDGKAQSDVYSYFRNGILSKIASDFNSYVSSLGKNKMAAITQLRFFLFRENTDLSPSSEALRNDIWRTIIQDNIIYDIQLSLEPPQGYMRNNEQLLQNANMSFASIVVGGGDGNIYNEVYVLIAEYLMKEQYQTYSLLDKQLYTYVTNSEIEDIHVYAKDDNPATITEKKMEFEKALELYKKRVAKLIGGIPQFDTFATLVYQRMFASIRTKEGSVYEPELTRMCVNVLYLVKQSMEDTLYLEMKDNSEELNTNLREKEEILQELFTPKEISANSEISEPFRILNDAENGTLPMLSTLFNVFHVGIKFNDNDGNMFTLIDKYFIDMSKYDIFQSIFEKLMAISPDSSDVLNLLAIYFVFYRYLLFSMDKMSNYLTQLESEYYVQEVKKDKSGKESTRISINDDIQLQLKTFWKEYLQTPVATVQACVEHFGIKLELGPFYSFITSLLTKIQGNNYTDLKLIRERLNTLFLETVLQYYIMMSKYLTGDFKIIKTREEDVYSRKNTLFITMADVRYMFLSIVIHKDNRLSDTLSKRYLIQKYKEYLTIEPKNGISQIYDLDKSDLELTAKYERPGLFLTKVAKTPKKEKGGRRKTRRLARSHT